MTRSFFVFSTTSTDYVACPTISFACVTGRGPGGGRPLQLQGDPKLTRLLQTQEWAKSTSLLPFQEEKRPMPSSCLLRGRHVHASPPSLEGGMANGSPTASGGSQAHAPSLSAHPPSFSSRTGRISRFSLSSGRGKSCPSVQEEIRLTRPLRSAKEPRLYLLLHP